MWSDDRRPDMALNSPVGLPVCFNQSLRGIGQSPESTEAGYRVGEIESKKEGEREQERERVTSRKERKGTKE